jgi:hypothetical protein
MKWSKKYRINTRARARTHTVFQNYGPVSTYVTAFFIHRISHEEADVTANKVTLLHHATKRDTQVSGLASLEFQPVNSIKWWNLLRGIFRPAYGEKSFFSVQKRVRRQIPRAWKCKLKERKIEQRRPSRAFHVVSSNCTCHSEHNIKRTLGTVHF